MSKLHNLLLLLSSLIGYLSWGEDNHAFLFEAEWEVFSKLFSEPLAVMHPFILLPLLGQLLLIITLFQSTPSKRLTFISIGCLGLLFGIMTLIGLLTLKWTILLSTLPFWCIVGLIFRFYKKTK
ncbi:hypothetical protein H9X57_01645 [Flavobacterium piscinae]|uniref:Uncharacterized protein n=1 Tax=Flavobacterium piscinae TaxID=2506424 RepID=A0A4Q1KNC1_9FLAO|nr:hypothetical protein [Flavobacterium piscinae]MBC8882577.1 hypothetical protein [Flavobacterium piscinae]RXR31262.1 hypothetical protein EQG68_10270 [Flavobacterium piscinae]